MEIHVYHHILLPAEMSAGIQDRLDKILGILQENQKQEEEIMQEFEDLKAAVAAETEVTQAAVTLIDGLAAKLDALKDAPTSEAVQALVDELNADKAVLAAAVAANTPAAPEAAPEPAAEEAPTA
jgi:hypothetical protein